MVDDDARRELHAKFSQLRHLVESTLAQYGPALDYMLAEDARLRRQYGVGRLTTAQRAELERQSDHMALALQITAPSTVDLLLELDPATVADASIDSLGSLELFRGLLRPQ